MSIPIPEIVLPFQTLYALILLEVDIIYNSIKDFFVDFLIN